MARRNARNAATALPPIEGVERCDPGVAVTEGEFAIVFELYRRGYNARQIADATGRNERTIRKYWHDGIRGAAWGTPIRVQLENEKTAARIRRDEAVLLEEKDRQIHAEAAAIANRSAAKRDALDARTAEANLVKLVRGDVSALAGAAVGLLPAATRLATAIGQAVDKLAKSTELDPEKGLAVLQRTSRFIRDVTEAGHKAMEMERLLLGDPTGGGGKLASEAANMTVDDAMVELQNASMVFESLKARKLRLIQGGAAGEASTAPAEASTPEAPALDGGGVAFDAARSHVVNGTGPGVNGATSEAGEKSDTGAGTPGEGEGR